MAQPSPQHAIAGKLAQLLGEVIVHHAPWTSDIAEEAKWRHTEQFLERFEAHAKGQLRPLLGPLADDDSLPEPIRALLREALDPPEQFSSALQALFLWGVVSNIIGTSLEPFMQQVSNTLWPKAVRDGIAKPLDASVIATAVARGLTPENTPTVPVPDWALTEAAMTGVGRSDLNMLASIVGLPPALQELLELYRRHVIALGGEDRAAAGVAGGPDTPIMFPDHTVAQGLKEGDFRDDWVDVAMQLAHSWLTPLDFVRAAVQKQMGYSEARGWASATGLDVTTQVPVDVGTTGATPDMFGLAFSVAGRPPGPVQLGNMALRGIIPWEGTGADKTTFQQGIAESDVKTKWTDKLQALMEYVPPVGTISTLLTRGGITSEQARGLWAERGVPSAIQAALQTVATEQHIEQSKLLARSEVLTGYYDGIFSDQQATTLLGDLGYEDQVARDMLSIEGFRREITAINRVVSRTMTLYAAHRLTAADAERALIAAGVEHDQALSILQIWESLREQPIRVPTVREIGRAVKYGTITDTEALQELADLGYQPRDAAIVLSTYAEAAVKPLPPAGTTITG